MTSEPSSEASDIAAPRAFQSLAHPRYRYFAVGALVSGVGSWSVRVIQLLIVLDQTGGSGAAAGLLAACQYLPVLLLGPRVGLAGDRGSKRGLLLAGQGVMGAAAVLQGITVLTGRGGAGLTLLIALVFGVGAAADNSMRMALAPELVAEPDIVNAVSLNSVSLQLGRLIGPASAGLLTSWCGTGWAVLLSAAGFGVFAVLLTRLEHEAPMSALPARGAVRDGLRYTRADRTLFITLVIIGVAGLVGPNLTTMVTVLVRIGFHGSPAQVGLVSSALAVGALGGALWTARRSVQGARTVAWAAAVLGGLTAASAAAPDLVILTVLLVPTGFSALLMVTVAAGLVQTEVLPAYRGRVTSLFAIALVAGVPLGSPLFGLLSDLLGPRAATAVMGTAVAVFATGTGLAMATSHGSPPSPAGRL